MNPEPKKQNVRILREAFKIGVQNTRDNLKEFCRIVNEAKTSMKSTF